MEKTITSKREPIEAPKPPLVPGLPFLGSALELTRDPLGFFVKNYHQLGSIFRVRVPNQSFTVMAGPEANTFMSRVGDEYLSSREIWTEFAQEWGTEALHIHLEGTPHSHLRQVTSRGYSQAAILPHTDLLVQTTQQMVSQWHPGQRVKVVDVMRQLVADQLGLALVNRSAGEYLQDLRRFFCTNLNVTFKRSPKWVLRSPAYLKAKARVMELGREIIAAHRAHPPIDRKPDLIDDLLQATDETGQPFSEATLVAHAVSPFVGGLETVANTCAFMLYALLKHPEVLERVTAEVDAVFAQGNLTASALKSMISLHGAAMETLRMYPSGLALQRIAKQSFKFAGYQVKCNEPVIVVTGASHFLPGLFPEPYTFEIERYQQPRNEHHQPGAFAPFGLGAHTCLGKGIAEAQVMVIMATLLHEVHLQLDPPSYKLKIVHDPNTSPRNFCVRVIEHRH